MDSLKPCPFCGGAVELVKTHTVDGSDWIQHVPKDGGSNCGLSFDAFNLEGDLATAWNLRSHEDRERVLRACLVGIKAGGVPRPVGKRWRADGEPSKLDDCVHGIGMRAECANCTATYIDSALSLMGGG